jgi:hypothetical protein
MGFYYSVKKSIFPPNEGVVTPKLAGSAFMV